MRIDDPDGAALLGFRGHVRSGPAGKFLSTGVAHRPGCSELNMVTSARPARYCSVTGVHLLPAVAPRPTCSILRCAEAYLRTGPPRPEASGFRGCRWKNPWCTAASPITTGIGHRPDGCNPVMDLSGRRLADSAPPDTGEDTTMHLTRRAFLAALPVIAAVRSSGTGTSQEELPPASPEYLNWSLPAHGYASPPA